MSAGITNPPDPEYDPTGASFPTQKPKRAPDTAAPPSDASSGVAKEALESSGSALSRVRDAVSSAASRLIINPILDRLSKALHQKLVEDVIPKVVPKIEGQLQAKYSPKGVLREQMKVYPHFGSIIDVLAKPGNIKGGMVEALRPDLIATLSAVFKKGNVEKLAAEGLDIFTDLAAAYHVVKSKGISDDSPEFVKIVMEHVLKGRGRTLEEFEKEHLTIIKGNINAILKKHESGTGIKHRITASGLQFLTKFFSSPGQAIKGKLGERQDEERKKLAATSPFPGTVTFKGAARAALIHETELRSFKAFLNRNVEVIGMLMLERLTSELANIDPKAEVDGKAAAEELDDLFKTKIEALQADGVITSVLAEVFLAMDIPKVVDGIAEPWRDWASS